MNFLKYFYVFDHLTMQINYIREVYLTVQFKLVNT